MNISSCNMQPVPPRPDDQVEGGAKRKKKAKAKKSSTTTKAKKSKTTKKAKKTKKWSNIVFFWKTSLMESLMEEVYDYCM